MAYERYVPNIDAWIAHFSGTDHLEHKKFHIVDETKKLTTPLTEVPMIKLVSPTEQAVHQARATLERERDSRHKRRKRVQSLLMYNNQQGDGNTQGLPPPPGLPNKKKEKCLNQMSCIKME